MIITGCSYKKLTNHNRLFSLYSTMIGQFLIAYNHLRLRLRYYRIGFMRGLQWAVAVWMRL